MQPIAHKPSERKHSRLKVLVRLRFSSTDGRESAQELVVRVSVSSLREPPATARIVRFGAGGNGDMVENLNLRRLLHQIDQHVACGRAPTHLIVGSANLPELLTSLPPHAWSLRVLGFRIELADDPDAAAQIAS